MKKKLILIVILLTTFLSNAQQKLSQEQFKKIVDNMTCVCINEALENSAVDCEKTLQENEIPLSDSKTLDLYKEFQKLKNTTDSKEFSISFLTNDVYNSSKYEKIKAFANKRKSTTLEDIKEKINKKVTEVINSNSKAVTSDDQTSDSIDHNYNSDSIAQASQNHQSPLDETNSTETKSQENGLLEFMKGYGFSFILLMLITSLYLYIRRRNFASINRVESMLNENDKNRESQNKFHIPNNSNAPQNRLLEDLSDKVRILEGKIYSLEEKLSKINVSIPEVITEVAIPSVTKQEDKIFYKHAPHERGYFDTDDDVNFNDAVFKFTINRNNPNTATFEIIKDKKKLILDYPNKYIKPVCTELNALNQNANNITIVPGTVEKRGNQWVVKTKVQIKYE